jgi:hypothetical protein
VEDDMLQQLNVMCSVQGDLGDAIADFKTHTQMTKRKNDHRAEELHESLIIEDEEAAML